MGFNKKYVSLDTIKKLLDKEQNLNEYFNKFDAFVFTDNISIEIYNLILMNKPFKHLIK